VLFASLPKLLSTGYAQKFAKRIAVILRNHFTAVARSDFDGRRCLVLIDQKLPIHQVVTGSHRRLRGPLDHQTGPVDDRIRSENAVPLRVDILRNQHHADEQNTHNM